MYSLNRYSSLVRCSVMLAAIAGAQIASAGTYIGYMNVFFNASGSQGSYIFGSSWGVPDMKTTVVTSNTGTLIGDQLILEPNYNTYTDSLAGTNGDRVFWTNSTDGGVTPGPLGNKWMNASTYEETANLAVPSYTLSGNVTANTLNTGLYTAKAFIKVLDPGAGYATVLNDSVTLPASGPFIVNSNLSLYQGKLLQVGFSMDGLNANPVDAGSNGSVALTITAVPEPSSVGLLAAGGGLLVAAWRSRRKS